jgi:hypothetical protein
VLLYRAISRRPVDPAEEVRTDQFRSPLTPTAGGMTSGGRG